MTQIVLSTRWNKNQELYFCIGNIYLHVWCFYAPHNDKTNHIILLKNRFPSTSFPSALSTWRSSSWWFVSTIIITDSPEWAPPRWGRRCGWWRDRSLCGSSAAGACHHSHLLHTVKNGQWKVTNACTMHIDHRIKYMHSFLSSCCLYLVLLSRNRVILCKFLSKLKTDGVWFDQEFEGQGPLVPLPGDGDPGAGGRHHLPGHQRDPGNCEELLKVLIPVQIVWAEQLVHHPHHQHRLQTQTEGPRVGEPGRLQPRSLG